MAEENKPIRDKDPKKVLAGQKGGLARANNQKKGSQASEKPPKRKRTAPFADSSDFTDDLDDVRPHRKRTMLEGTPSEQTAPRMQIPKLNMSGTPIKNTYFPHIMTGKEYPLPITIQTDDNKIYSIKNAANYTNGDTSFWQMLARMLEEVREQVGLEAFGASIDNANKDLHLNVAAHLFPQLLTITGQLRYTKANPSELIVAKKNYREFLTAIRDNTTRLLAAAKDDLTKMNPPLSTSVFTKELLRIIPRQPPTIPEHEHRTQIDGHETMLAHAAEIIRQELTCLGMVASNYAEEARKASITLTTIYACLRRLLDPDTTTNTDTVPPSNADTAFPSEVKDEPLSEIEDEVDPPSNNSAKSKGPSTNNAAPVVSSSTGTSDPPPAPPHHPSPLALPETLIKELFKGHKCHCTDCEPDIMQRMYDEARGDLIRSQEAVIGTEQEEIIRQAIRDKQLPEMRQQIQLQLEEEMRTEMWNKEREDLRDRLAEEMLPAVKKQAQQEVTSELREKLRAEVIEQQRAANRKRMEEERRRMEEEGII